MVKRKKYNKIILISNIGDDYGGLKFIEEARKIIGNKVIALFLSLRINHKTLIARIRKIRNAIFCNDSKLFEEYLNCFSDKVSDKKYEIRKVIDKIEDQYNITFKIYDDFLKFPNYKEQGKYNALSF